LPSIEGLSSLDNDSQIFHSFFNGGLNIVGQYGSRVTFRFFDPNSDIINQAAPFLPLIYYRRNFGVFDPLSGPFSGEYADKMIGFMRNTSTPDWRYNEPGNDKTSNSAGGYVLFFDKGSDTINNQALKQWMITNSTFNALLGLINFDTIFYSSYYDSYAFCKHQFRSTPGGNVIMQTIINVCFDKLFDFFFINLLGVQF